MIDQLEIIYQDDNLVAVNKPPGLLVHRTNIDRHENRFAVQLLRNQLKKRVYPVHRLDKPTSGILLFALDSHTARQMNMQFRQQQIQKSYFAVVRGWPEDSGRIDYPLVDGPIKAAYGGQQDSDKPRTAVTEYRTLCRTELPVPVGRYPSSRYALIEARPQSGRRHQLRRHFKHIFHPLIRDTTYGDGAHNRMFREQFGCHRLLLHAVGLGFRHPVTGELHSFQASLSRDFLKVLAQLGMSFPVWD